MRDDDMNGIDLKAPLSVFSSVLAQVFHSTGHITVHLERHDSSSLSALWMLFTYSHCAVEIFFFINIYKQRLMCGDRTR